MTLRLTSTRAFSMGVGVLCLLLLSSTRAMTQTVRTGSIAGTVKDDTGASLPGVTVTLTSPALQVPQIVKVTEAGGEYQFADLPLGIYRVSFELTGFTRLTREDIVLTAGFAARVDIALKIGSVAESITVSGQSPIVDVTTTRGGATLTKDFLETIPNSHAYTDIQGLTPGLIPSQPPQTGGVLFAALAGSWNSYGLSGQQRLFMDGVSMYTDEAPDFGISAEVSTKTYGATAETLGAGAQVEMVVKSGGNEFHGRLREEYLDRKMSSTNVDANLRSQGIQAGDALLFSNDFVGDLGGRIVRDQLWFYSAVRLQRNASTVTGYSQATGPDGLYGTIDDVPGEPPASNREATGKLSYQSSPRHRFTGFYNYGLALQPEAQGSRFLPRESTLRSSYPNARGRIEWQGSLTEHLLAELSFGFGGHHITYTNYTQGSPTSPSTLDNVTKILTGESFDNSRAGVERPVGNRQTNGTVSYFVGAHALKTGFTAWRQSREQIAPNLASGNYQLVFDTVGGVPRQPTQLNGQNRPVYSVTRANYYGAYLTDTWRMSSKLTANLGLRLDRTVNLAPASVKVQGTFGTAGTYPQVDAGTFTALAPRAGIAFDLLGDGKTVAKASYGRYNNDFLDAFAAVYQQNNVQVYSYRWRDPNGDRLYQPGEINLNTNGLDFISVTGTTNPILNTAMKLPRTHQVSASLERELVSNVSMRALYVFWQTRNSFQTVNPLRPYSAYNIPIARQDPGPDGVAGNTDDGPMVTIYDYDPAYRGTAFVAQSPQNRPAGHDDHANSFELLIAKRGGAISGNASYLATKNHRWLSSSTVLIAQSPNDNFYPLDETWTRTFRLAAAYSAPFNIQLSASYTALNGVPGQRTYLFRSLPQLSTLSVRLEPFGAHAGPVRHNLNLHVGKRLSVGRRRLELGIDALNATNSNAAWTSDYTSGPTFNYTTRIPQPRAARLTLLFDF